MDNLTKRVKNKLAKPIGYMIWILILFLTVSTVRNFGRVSRIRSDIEKEKARLQKIEAENKELEAKIALAESPEFIEKEIRNKLGFVKTGETVVILPDEAIIRKLAPERKSDRDILPDPNWKKWLNLFGV